MNKKIFSVVLKAILVVCIIVILWQLVMVRLTLSSIESNMCLIKQGLFASTKIRLVPKPSIEDRVNSIKIDILSMQQQLFSMQQQLSLIDSSVSLIHSDVSSIESDVSQIKKRLPFDKKAGEL